MIRQQIDIFPFDGSIIRVIEGTGRNPDTEVVIYEGKMDAHMTIDEQGHSLQTSSYVISIPLTKDAQGAWIIPHKGDKVNLVRYGEEIEFVVDNADPSQLNGVSIYVTRQSW